MLKPKVLIFIAYFYPGYKAGGALRSSINLVNLIARDRDVYVVTSDRDVGDKFPYSDVRANHWMAVGESQVLYLKVSPLSVLYLFRHLRSCDFDVIYLNSFFNFHFSIVPLLFRFIGLLKGSKCVLGPRGEFDPAALAVGRLKKISYLFIVKVLGLHKGLVWHASTQLELDHIKKVFVDSSTISEVIPDPLFFREKVGSVNAVLKDGSGTFRIIFLSRIHPNKNLLFLLDALSRIRQLNIVLNIYGPIEDDMYWSSCLKLLKGLSHNMTVRYRGTLRYDEVCLAFEGHHLFCFPTLCENFGHVIFESLSVGTPVLLSDKTPWTASAIRSKGGLVVRGLDSNAWAHCIESWAAMDVDEYMSRRVAARDLYDSLAAPSMLGRYLSLLR